MTSARRRRLAIVSISTVLAVSAAAGAVGLATGALATSALADRLPLHSPALAGCALAVIVALPASVTALRGRCADATASGALLCVWIVVELAVIRELSFLQPVCFAAGATLVVLGHTGTEATPAGAHRRTRPER